METRGRKIIFYSSYPLICKNLTKGITEGIFAGSRNNYMLLRVLWTGIFMITQLVGITAREYFLYCVDDILAKRESLTGINNLPNAPKISVL
jgi:hypothetical protein